MPPRDTKPLSVSPQIGYRIYRHVLLVEANGDGMMAWTNLCEKYEPKA